jgi:hypothetical protein
MDMGSTRFALLAGVAFGLTFVGISWSQRGFPVMTMRVEPLKPDARIPTFEESVKKGIRKDWENSKTAQSDGDKERDKLRLELLQAAIGYKLSPCDETMKKNLVDAVTNYTRAWQVKFHCKLGVDGCPANEDDRIDYAAGLFKTPADINVHKQLREAYDQGGITKADFPASVGRDAFLWTGMPFGEPAACNVGRKADNRR